MQIETLEKNQIPIAVVYSEQAVITDVQSALDFIMQIKYETGAQRVVINKKALCGELFYSQHQACRRNFAKIYSLSCKACGVRRFFALYKQTAQRLFYESNQGKDFFFTATREQAIEKLTSANKRA